MHLLAQYQSNVELLCHLTVDKKHALLYQDTNQPGIKYFKMIKPNSSKFARTK